MAKRAPILERRAGERAKRYTPRPHPEVDAALEAAGLSPAAVYRARRWDKAAIDLPRLGGALHALTCAGWRVSSVSGSALRYPAAFRPPRAGADPVRDRDERGAELRLLSERGRGLAFVFDRSPESIEIHLGRYRAYVASLAADPIRRLAALPEYSSFLTRAELGALATFIAAFGKYYAAIGYGAHTVAAGDGVPMTDEARIAAQDAYKAITAAVLRCAGPRALSACQDLAANRGQPDRYLLQAAARAIEPRGTFSVNPSLTN